MGSYEISNKLIELGKRIRARRLESHLSQEDFAELAGVSVNTVIRAENGQTAVSVETFSRMVGVLGVTADELLGVEPMGKKEKEQVEGMVFNIHHLKKCDREVVLCTMNALIEGLSRSRQEDLP